MLPSYSLRAVLAAALFTFTSIASGQAPVVSDEIAEAMQDRDFDLAVKEIDKALEVPGGPHDYLDYLKGRAFHYQRDYAKAIEHFRAHQQKYPKSDWARRVRFAMAMSHARLGGFMDAEQIYRQESEYLLSLDRKQEIAEIYLEFASGYFQPQDPLKKPDYAKALSFFELALQVGPEESKRAEIQLKIGKCFQKLGKHQEAIQRYQAILKQHADSPLLVEVRLELGQSYLAIGNRHEARRTWKDLLDEQPAVESPLLAQASYNIALTYGMPQPGSLSDLDLGVTALWRFVEKHPTHKLASKALLEVALAYQHHGRYQDASEVLKNFIADKRFADREEIADARVQLGRCYQLQKNYDLALETWKVYLSKHPAHKQWSLTQQLIIDTEYMMAADKAAEKKYAEARNLWQTFLNKYPLDKRASDILYSLGGMNFVEEKWDAAIADWKYLVSKYPGTQAASHGQMMIAVTLEEKLGQLDDAIAEYKKVTWGNWQSKAQSRIQRLTAKQLTIETERIFRSDESPTIKAAVRNIEKLKVRAYRVDLETYFRKMHLATGLESLDIALIDPDIVMDYEVPDYQKHKRCEFDIKLEAPDGKKAPGVMLVTVSSDDLEATTMLLQSDLDIIVKSSRDELFVLAQNMKTGKPWGKTRLLLSNGKEVFKEVETQEDGVFQGAFEQLKSAADVRVFAIAGDNTASNVINLQGIGVSQGLSDKGYIYTEHPAYRPQQIVNIRGVIRKESGDTYTIETGKKFTLNVFDPRSRIVWQQEVELNEFGSFHAHFRIPDGAPQGSYRLLVSDKDKQQYQGTFSVYDYQLQNMSVEVDTKKRVYYRGERIEGDIKVAYYYGSPVVGKQVRYRLANGPVATAETDDEGKVHFEFETKEFRDSQTLALVVSVPEHNINQSTPFVLATKGFSYAIKSDRSTYLVGESFEVAVTTIDAESKPLAVATTLEVLQRTRVGNRTGERLIETHELKTDEKDGTARVSIAIKEGGDYFLRAKGADQFEQQITGQYGLKISGDDDTVRLRILAGQHTYKVGDEAKVQIHWREKPSLALVTYQGTRVLGYQLVNLKKGANQLTVPMTAALAPNFNLEICVMLDVRLADSKLARFHQASGSFVVQRDLLVSAELVGAKADAPLLPGADAKLRIRTTDPQGNPVAAEVSVAMIEQSLLDRFGMGAAKIGDFFGGGRRTMSVRTTSSIDFTYEPKTSGINTALLAEQDRLERELREGDQAADFSFFLGFSRGEAGNGQPPAGANEFEQSTGQGATNNRSVNGIALGIQLNDLAQQVDNVVRSQRSLSARSNSGREATRGWADQQQQAGQLFGGNVQWDRFAGTQHPRQVAVIANDGSFAYLNVQTDELHVNDFLSAIARDNELVGHLVTSETGYWNPQVATDAKGEAVIEFTVPDRSSAWKLIAKGISQDTLAGDFEQSVTSRKDLFGELKLPLAFTDGDQVDIQATVHNRTGDEGEIEVTLRTTIGGKTISATKKVAGKSEVSSLLFENVLKRPAGDPGAAVIVTFELLVKQGDAEDQLVKTVPVLPYGMPVFATASGASSSDSTAWVQWPEGLQVTAPSLEIVVGPTVEDGLLDILLGQAPACQVFNRSFASGTETTTSDLLAGLALQQLFNATREADSPYLATLDARVRSSISSLISSQRDDGGWSWTGVKGDSDRYISSRAYWALVKARQSGYEVQDDVVNKSANYLRGQISKTANTDYESKAVLLHALSVGGLGDFPLANRLYRGRQSLSNSALIYLALAFAEMDRKTIAEELLTQLNDRKLDDLVPRRKAELSSLPSSHSPVELRALLALAIQAVRPQDPKNADLVKWLLEHRVGHRWQPEKATGPAALAACQWYSQAKFETEHYKLAVFVNDRRVKDLEFDKEMRTQVVKVPADLLRPGKQRINFQLQGRGRFSYNCSLQGFVAAKNVVSTTKDWEVRREYLAAQLERDGKLVPRGFDVVRGSYSTFHNPLTEVPVAQRGQVRLQLWRNGVPSDTPAEHLEYLVVTEPLPSGVTVIEDSIKGGFERYEIRPGAIVFYVGNRRSISDIRYDVYGYLPGQYKASSTVVRDAYRPDQFAVHQPSELAVLPLGEKSKDEYRLTPREMYELGNRHFARGEMKEATKLLNELLAKWDIQPQFLKQATQNLLDAHLKIGPSQRVVHHFEVIKEKWPEIVIPNDKIMLIGTAYHEMGEYERCWLIYRATVESSFLDDSRVAGALQKQGEVLKSIDVMNGLLREYPAEPYVAAATFDLAQQVYGLAAQASTNKQLRSKKITRVALIRNAVTMLNNFLTAHPVDPAADQAAFSLATGLLELEKYQSAIESCEKFAERYPQSADVDGFLYTVGFCHFALGQTDEALQTCARVAQLQHTNPQTGREEPSSHRDRSIYILAQIYHSLDEAAKAIAEYTRVEEQFVDAREAIRYFARRDISIPEVTTVVPGKKVELGVKFRNVKALELKVYRIDLMKFGLLRRNMQGITDINLAGIQPNHEATVELGDGKDYRDREKMVTLPLEKEGAYLVVCRGDNLHTSGLVLISPLEVEVQEDVQSGRVRATIKNVVGDRFVSDVHVKTIGSANSEFISGDSDLRGIYVADGVRGNVTVIAQAEGRRYAFYRGKQFVGQPLPQTTSAAPSAAGQNAEGQGGGQGKAVPQKKGLLLEGLYLRNSVIQSGNLKRQEEQYFNDSSGVKAEAVK